MADLKEKLKDVCFNIDGSEWDEDRSRCILKAQGGSIFVSLIGDNRLLAKKKYYTKNTPWEHTTAEIKLNDVKDIDGDWDEFREARGIIAVNDDDETLHIASYRGDSFWWGTIWYASITYEGKNVDVTLL